MAENTAAKTGKAKPMRPAGLFRRLAREKGGATAIEFAILALPFFVVTFASIETFVAFFGEQVLANANDTMARKIRTGEVTFGLGRTTDKTKDQFRELYCDEISFFLSCDTDRLYIDVRSFTTFADIPTEIPRTGTDLNTATVFTPGGAEKINVVRSYYRWEVMTDLVRPYVTKLRSAGSSMPHDYLMVATNTVVNEAY
nr:TadE/TadG family type IV pilus assembly protein [Pararhizobium capsulatum]